MIGRKKAINQPLCRRLRADQRGATIVELALAFPVIAALLLGGIEVSRQSYLQSVLYGAVQKAGRDGTLENGSASTSDIDTRVTTAIRALAKHGTVTVDRKAHASFKRAGQPEQFTDGNGNNTRDGGECFEDANTNGIWDTVSGRGGRGGADEIVVYTVSLRYNRSFPLNILGWGATNTLKATTVLRNQPYTNASVTAAPVICT